MTQKVCEMPSLRGRRAIMRIRASYVYLIQIVTNNNNTLLIHL